MRKVSLLRGLPAVLAPLLTTAPGASALTLRVPVDYPTILDGMDAAVSGDIVLVAPGTYSDWRFHTDVAGNTASTCAVLKAGVTLRSESGPEATVIDMTDSGSDPRVLFATFERGAAARVEGFTITGSVPGVYGVQTRFCDKVVFFRCVFRDIESSGSGATALEVESTDLELIECAFVDIHAGFLAARVFDSPLLVRECRFESCTEIPLYVSQSRTGIGPIVVRDCAFLDGVNQFASALTISGQDSPVQVVGCRFERNSSPSFGPAGIFATSGSGPLEVRRNVFVENHGGGSLPGGAVWAQADAGATMTIEENTFFRCSQEYSAEGGAAIFMSGGAITFRKNSISECAGAEAVDIRSSDMLTNDCNVYWKNPDGNLDRFVRGPNSRVLDPQICDPGGGFLFLRGSSPCLPQNSRGCGRIGALERGCDPVSLTGESWGRVKGRYRGGRP